MNEMPAHIARFLIHDVGGNVTAALLIAGVGWLVRRLTQTARRHDESRNVQD
ncbi:hypothetical protein ACOBQB_10645 [Streptomyces sp. G5(2025)]|uniref:hypothetical protein n=1 Tax=Streptomyces sp. G5(2025) TaxID=3406628 RepID=UPI003C1F4264